MTAILDIPAADYHADQVDDRPTLSASIAKLLISHSPLHAYTAHPRLNPDYVKQEDDKFSVGTSAHALLLQGESVFEVILADDWKKQATRDLRDEAKAAGRIPLLAKDVERVQAMVSAVREQIGTLDVQPPLFSGGTAERTLVWDDMGVLCRARLDWLRDDLSAVDDLKTTSRPANPEQWSRTLFSMGYDVQAAFYLRGIRAVTGADAEFRFVVVETAPPYALSVLSLMPAALELANDKVTYAINRWRDCLASGVWAGYPTRVCWAEAPGWHEAAWMEREAREAA